MNDITRYNYCQNEIRVVMVDDNLWFVAKDVANILEMRDATACIQGLDEEEVHTRKVCTNAGDREMAVISEAGLYTVLIRSNKPQAKPFNFLCG